MFQAIPPKTDLKKKNIAWKAHKIIFLKAFITHRPVYNKKKTST